MGIFEIPEILMIPISPGEVVDYQNTYSPPPCVEMIEQPESPVNRQNASDDLEIKDLSENTNHVAYSIAENTWSEPVEQNIQMHEQTLRGSSADFAISNPKNIKKRLFIKHGEQTKKRRINTAKWAANIKKGAKNTGQEFRDIDEKLILHKRQLLDGCGVSCKFKCESKLNQEQRKKIFNNFWSLGNHMRQWNFIQVCLRSMRIKDSAAIICNDCNIPEENSLDVFIDGSSSSNHQSGNIREESIILPVPPVEVKQPKTVLRSRSNRYFFNVEQKEVRVCKTMFLRTLNISDSCVKTVTKKLNKG